MSKGNLNAESELSMPVRRERLVAGLSVTMLAKQIGKSRVWLAMREGRKRKLKPSDAQELFNAIRRVTIRRSQLLETRSHATE
jgi:hypothetical protein